MNRIFEASFAVLGIEITYDLHQSVLGGGRGAERPDRAKMSRIRKVDCSSESYSVTDKLLKDPSTIVHVKCPPFCFDWLKTRTRNTFKYSIKIVLRYVSFGGLI